MTEHFPPGPLVQISPASNRTLTDGQRGLEQERLDSPTVGGLRPFKAGRETIDLRFSHAKRDLGDGASRRVGFNPSGSGNDCHGHTAW